MIQSVNIKNLMELGGALLATQYKKSIKPLKNITVALSLYNLIFNQINDICKISISSHSNSYQEQSEKYTLRKEINAFFSNLDNDDVHNIWWNIDDEGKTLFNNIDYTNMSSKFPFLIRFFNLFYDENISGMNEKLSNLINQKTPEKYVKNLTLQNLVSTIKNEENPKNVNTQKNKYYQENEMFNMKYVPIKQQIGFNVSYVNPNESNEKEV